MSISRAQVEHIADLARLGLTEEEKGVFQEQLSAILAYMEMLNRLDTEAIPPTATVLPLRNVMAVDEPQAPWPQSEALANAPATEAGCFKVKAVLD